MDVMKPNTDDPNQPMLIGAARSIWEGSSALMTIEIAIESKLETAMKEHGITPLERVFITDSDIRHIRKHHAKNAQSRGQIDIVPDDFGCIPIVLNDFDSCRHADTDRLGNKRLELVKRIDDAFYVITVQRGERKLEVKTMWKKPGASC